MYFFVQTFMFRTCMPHVVLHDCILIRIVSMYIHTWNVRNLINLYMYLNNRKGFRCYMFPYKYSDTIISHVFFHVLAGNFSDFVSVHTKYSYCMHCTMFKFHAYTGSPVVSEYEFKSKVSSGPIRLACRWACVCVPPPFPPVSHPNHVPFPR